MAQETLLQHWIFTQFALPFLLVFFIVFGVLEKSKLFGSDKKQLNAGIAFIVGAIFVALVEFTLVIQNLVLFLTVALVVMFVGLLLWGFVAGDKGLEFGEMPPGLKWVIGIAVVIVTVAGLLWALGTSFGFFEVIFGFLFQSDWSQTLWTNVAFIAVIIIAIVLVLRSQGK